MSQFNDQNRDQRIADVKNGYSQLWNVKSHAELQALSKEYGNSFFILDTDRFRTNIRALQSAFLDHYPKVRIGYSFKTNYTPALCKIALEEGAYAEVVSEMEFALAKTLVSEPSRTIFNGPYKAEWAFKEAALSGATINLDSHRDLEMLSAASRDAGNSSINAVIRCNFSIGEQISRFGFDTEANGFQRVVESIAELQNVNLRGLHCHFPDRDLESFGVRAHKIVELAKRLFPDQPPEILNLGGGYFSNMPESLKASRIETPATFSDYGRLVGTTLSKAFAGADRMPTLFIEPGTAVVADTQMFYSRVISTKTIRGKGFATIAGSIFDISPNARSKGMPFVHIAKRTSIDETAEMMHEIVGYTCIEGDVLTTDLSLPIRAGDFVGYSNVGSYSVVMRPPFILPANPVLMQDGPDGAISIAKRRQSNQSVFQDFEY